MTCDHCCGADRIFDLKSARKELKKYKKKGIGGATKKLLNGLAPFNLKGSTLLDIGGGIGAIQWNFLNRGASHTTDIDASSGYLEVAKSYAEEKQFSDKTAFMHGDFIDLSDQLDVHSFVTLDKVVCCYPDYKLLLSNALSKTEDVLALTFPMDNWISRLLATLGALFTKLIRNPFRPYIHPSKGIHDFILAHNFSLSFSEISFPWHVRVYKRLE